MGGGYASTLHASREGLNVREVLALGPKFAVLPILRKAPNPGEAAFLPSDLNPRQKKPPEGGLAMYQERIALCDGGHTAPAGAIKRSEPKPAEAGQRRRDNGSSTHLTIGDRASRQLLQRTDSSAKIFGDLI